MPCDDYFKINSRMLFDSVTFPDFLYSVLSSSCILNLPFSPIFLSFSDDILESSFVVFRRIRDELIKICNSDKPSNGFLKLKETELLAHILPEIDTACGVEQNGSHKYDVFTHLLYALDYTAEKNFPYSSV